MARYSTDLATLRKEVELTTFRGGGPGGQHRNKVETAVRLHHPPSGVTVISADHRLQGRNREQAFERLLARLTALNRPVRPRRTTKPSRAAAERQLQNKRIRAKKKALRTRAFGLMNE